MTPTEQVRDLELIFDMTSHPGWKVLMKDMQDRVDALKEGMISNESSPYQIGLAQGHVKVYREMIALRAMLEHFLSEKAIDDGEAAAV
jgi:hypothetical protein